MKRLTCCLLAASVLAATAAFAQGAGFTASDPIHYPQGIYAGEVAGVATNSKGHVFVYQRAGNPYATIGSSRLFVHGQDQLLEFDAAGKFVREIGKGNYAWLVANSVRVDSHDNIWAVDRYSGMVLKFSPDGSQLLMLLGRKPESINVTIVGRPAAGGRGPGGEALAAAGGAPAGAPAAAQAAGAAPAGAPAAEGGRRRGPAGAGAQQDVFTGASDVAWDADGNIFVSDGFGGDNRIAKFTSDGIFVASFGKTGSDNDSLDSPRSIATDATGNVYVADHNNHRVQVLSNDLQHVVRTITGVGDPWAVCISPGAHPYLYVSNSNPMNDLDHGGEIYRAELDGTVLDRFGSAGKAPEQFATVNQMDCRQPNTLYTAEAGAYRVQKVKLR
jgi:sugar lactone lactonase YvrE